MLGRGGRRRFVTKCRRAGRVTATLSTGFVCDLKVRGALEYFLPELSVTALAQAELDAAYRDVVTPILAELVGAHG